jgi:hypothetical protein
MIYRRPKKLNSPAIWEVIMIHPATLFNERERLVFDLINPAALTAFASPSFFFVEKKKRKTSAQPERAAMGHVLALEFLRLST